MAPFRVARCEPVAVASLGGRVVVSLQAEDNGLGPQIQTIPNHCLTLELRVDGVAEFAQMDCILLGGDSPSNQRQPEIHQVLQAADNASHTYAIYGYVDVALALCDIAYYKLATYEREVRAAPGPRRFGSPRCVVGRANPRPLKAAVDHRYARRRLRHEARGGREHQPASPRRTSAASD